MPTCIVELVTSLSVSQFFLVSFYHPDGFYILVTAKKTSQEVAWSILVTDLISKIAERTQKNWASCRGASRIGASQKRFQDEGRGRYTKRTACDNTS